MFGVAEMIAAQALLEGTWPYGTMTYMPRTDVLHGASFVNAQQQGILCQDNRRPEASGAWAQHGSARLIFPRSRAMKIDRMERFVEWKRQKIHDRRMRHLALFMLWATLPPLALIVIGGAWRAFVWFVVS